MNKTPKILIGTLYSGENEFNACLNSLKKQTYTRWEQFILKNLPNKEAHETLYGNFMAQKDKFDIFLKLDADMVFMHENALNDIVDLFKKDGKLHHGQFAVKDWYSNDLIMGVHVTSNQAVWVKNENKLFVDRCPNIPGQRKLFYDGIAPFITHSPNPSNFQAYHFGVHRALKAFQYETDTFSSLQADYQWDILKKTWDHFLTTKDKRLGLTVLGAEHVIIKYVKHCHYDYTNTYLRDVFVKYQSLDSGTIYAQLKWKWETWYGDLRRFIIISQSKYFPSLTKR